MEATYYHPDPAIDAEVRTAAAEAHAFDVDHGLAKPGDCPECGWANNPDMRRRCRNCRAPLPHPSRTRREDASHE